MPYPSPEEHTRSYYAASVNTRTDYPALSGSITVDVCVVGAGFTGVSTALTLAERGHSVAVVEANRVGWGASGRNGGQVINGFTGAEKLVRYHGSHTAELIRKMKWRGNEIIKDRVKKYNIDCDLKPGFLEVARNARQMRVLEDEYADIKQRGMQQEFQLLDRAELEKTIGTSRYFGGLLSNRDGHVHPLNLCIGEARAASELGVRIFEQSPVIRIQHGDRPGVITDGGEVFAKSLVLAGNAYHLLEKKHLGGLLFPASSYVIATEPLGNDVVQEINPRDVAICDMNHVPDYYRLSADKRMLFGGVANYSGRELQDIKKVLIPRMLRLYPRLEGTRIDYEWGGKIGIIINRVLLMGRLGSNIFYSQGYCGHGVSPTHMAGEIMADSVEGKYDRLELFEKYPHTPVPLGRWAGNQLVALGMIYFKMLDLI